MSEEKRETKQEMGVSASGRFRDGLPDILPPTDDRIFKSLFMHPKAELALKSMISAFTGLNVKKAVVKNPILPISDTAEKQEVFDISCYTDEELVDVEMQANHMDGDNAGNRHKNIRYRSMYNVSDLYSSQESAGEDYGALKRTFQISICDYTVFPEYNDFMKSFRYRSSDGILLGKATTIVFVELSKIKTISMKPIAEMSPAEMWSVFLEYADKPRYRHEIAEIVTAKEEFQVATEVLSDISTDLDMRAKLHSQKMYRMDREHEKAVWRKEGLAEGRMEGRAEGRMEGRAEGRMEECAEIARKLLKRNRPVEEIMEDTGLSLEEIESIRTQNVEE